MHSVTQLWLIWKSSIKTKSLNTKPCPVGLSPRIICQASPFLLKMSQNCCTHQVWTAPPSPEPIWEVLGIEKILANSQKLLFSPIRKIPLNRFTSFAIKSFISSQTANFFIKQQFSSNHLMQSSSVAAVISVVSYFKFQATHFVLIWLIKVYWMLPLV